MSYLQPITIGLFWHSMNSDNLGVGALTIAHMDILRDAARTQGCKPRFLVLGWRDPRPWYFESDEIENRPFRLRHLVRPRGPVAASIAECDLVCDIGGGDSFTDIYGPMRFLTVWGSKLRVLLARKPLVLSPQTIGPFNKRLSRLLARQVMNRARLVATRDEPSTAFLSDLDVRTKTVEATDVAMRLPCDTPARRDEGPVRVGLNVSGLLFNGGYTQANQFGLATDYAAVTREIVTQFMAKDGVELHLVGHVQSGTNDVEDDQRVSEMLGREFPGIVIAPVFGSPSEAKSYIANMDFFMGSRMHATIAAFSAGVPVVPMAYSRKFGGVFETLGYQRVVDLKRDDAETILSRIREGFAERDTLRAEVARALEGVETKLDAYSAQLSSEIARLSRQDQRDPVSVDRSWRRQFVDRLFHAGKKTQDQQENARRQASR